MTDIRKHPKHPIHVKKGDIVGEKYHVLAHIASGGMSEVFLVDEKANTENRWAIKVVKRDHPLARKLEREAEILSSLEHPALPYVVDFFQNESYYFLVMEYTHGVSLYDYLEIHNQMLPVEQVIDIGKQLCDVLKCLHLNKPNPIIYRDIKPGNIIMKDDGTIALIDFGTARMFQEDIVKDTVRVGTVGFAAPEQFEKKQTDERTDLFSLGALFYYLLSEGKYVYIAQKPIKSFHSKLPKSLNKCIDKLVNLTPEDRPQSIMEVEEMLEAAEEELHKKTTKKKGLRLQFLQKSKLGWEEKGSE